MISPAMFALMLRLSLAIPTADDRVLLLRARSLVDKYGEQVWPGYSRAPFYVDLVEQNVEVLFCAPREQGFRVLGSDRITGCLMQTRQRNFPSDSASARDLSPGLSLVAIATPEQLGMNRYEWVITLIHEDFHQYQSTLRGYKAAVDRLGLSKMGGSWMLNYPFPYGEPQVGKAFTAMNNSGLAFLEAKSPVQSRRAIGEYLRARQTAQSAVSAADWRYYEFEIGQEGVAKWTEIAVASRAGVDDREMAKAAEDRRLSLAVSLRAMNKQGLGVWKRSVFYVLGPIEAEMLTFMGAPWRQEYVRKPFSFGNQLARACAAAPACN